MYYRARYYQPGVGRFASRDSFAGSIDAPATLNRFGYVQGKPTNMVDPSGHLALKLAGAIFLVTGMKMAYSFFSYMAPEIKRIVDLDMAGASLLEVFARVLLRVGIRSRGT